MDWNAQGGAAFPIPHTDAQNAPCAEHGMSLRDWFAGQALAGMDEYADPRRMADWAYLTADAMLEARKTGGDA